MTVDELGARASRYAALRWLGMGLFVASALTFLVALAAAGMGRAPWLGALPGIFAMGMSLGAFGTANDTAIHAMAELERRGNLPERHRREWATEQANRPGRSDAVHASPRAALVFPVLALVVMAWVLTRSLQSMA
jgi:hypothetical protein